MFDVCLCLPVCISVCRRPCRSALLPGPSNAITRLCDVSCVFANKIMANVYLPLPTLFLSSIICICSFVLSLSLSVPLSLSLSPPSPPPPPPQLSLHLRHLCTISHGKAEPEESITADLISHPDTGCSFVCPPASTFGLIVFIYTHKLIVFIFPKWQTETSLFLRSPKRKARSDRVARWAEYSLIIFQVNTQSQGDQLSGLSFRKKYVLGRFS